MADWEYPASLDPIHATTAAELRVASLLFSPLWGSDPDLAAYPDLAREVPSLDNGGIRPGRDGVSMAVRVKLVPGLHWSDGAPITADDVIFTVNAICSRTQPGRGTAGFDHIASQERRSDTEVVWHFGPRTRGSCGLDVDLASGVYPAVELLGPRLRLLPSHLLAAIPDSSWPALPFFMHPEASSGPFTFRSAVGRQLIDFAANPHYADGRTTPGVYGRARPRFDHAPRLQGLTYRFFNGRAAEVAALQNAEADLGFHLLPADVAELSRLATAQTLISPTLQGEYLNPNHGANTATGVNPPWVDDGPVLRALEQAIDRQALNTAAFNGTATISTGLFPAVMKAYAPPQPHPPSRSLDEARRALDGDGWRAGVDGVRSKNGRRLEFSLLAPCDSAPRVAEQAELVRQWAELGARAKPACGARASFFGSINPAGAFDMSLYSNTWSPDPSAWAPFAVSIQVPSALNPSGRNWNRCNDARLDEELARGGTSLDPATRHRAYVAAAAEWLAYGCTIPLLEWPSVVQRSNRLRNFLPNASWSLDTWNAADWGL